MTTIREEELRSVVSVEGIVGYYNNNLGLRSKFVKNSEEGSEIYGIIVSVYSQEVTSMYINEGQDQRLRLYNNGKEIEDGVQVISVLKKSSVSIVGDVVGYKLKCIIDGELNYLTKTTYEFSKYELKYLLHKHKV